MNNVRGKNKKSMIKIGPIMSLLIGLSFFTFVLFIALMETGKSKKPVLRQTISNPATKEEENSSIYNQADKNITALVLEVNTSDKSIKLFDIDKKEEIVLYYTGGSNITDKYGQPITAGQLEMGQIVDIACQSSKNKILALQPSLKAWEYIGVNNMLIDSSDKTIKIASKKYTYESPIVTDNDVFISLEDITEQDVLTVRGIDEIVWSVKVIKGHGTVRLIDCDAFLGGSVTIGYEAVQKITENMIVTVREGNYNLTAENGAYSGTKNVTVNRNEETVVSLGDLGPGYGQIVFEISPLGADLFIDGKLTLYASPVKLMYGEHKIEVSLGGYATYRGSLKVDQSEKKVQIILPELKSRESVSVVEIPGSNTDESDYIEYNNWDREQSSGEDDVETIEIPVDETSDEDPIVDKEHLIYIQNPKGVSVYLNGEYKGVSPGSFQKVIGRHVLTFIKQGYQTKSYTIDIADDGMDTYISLPDLEPDR